MVGARTLRSPSDPQEDIYGRAYFSNLDSPADIAVRYEADACTGFSNLSDDIGVAWPVQHNDSHVTEPRANAKSGDVL